MCRRLRVVVVVEESYTTSGSRGLIRGCGSLFVVGRQLDLSKVIVVHGVVGH